MKLDKWLYFPSIILFVYLVVRLIDMSQLSTTFPLYVTGDLSSYIGHLHFLSEYGFHNYVPNWYNGFISFLAYPPGFFYFALPFYWLTSSANFGFYLAMLILFILVLIATMLFAKSQGWSRIKGLTFYLILFANPIAIGNFVRLGRMPELFGWFNFIILCAILLYFKDKRINNWFLLFIPFYILLMLSHPAVIVFFHLIFLFGIMFFIKKGPEKLIILFSILFGLLGSCFWWLPFILNTLEQSAIVSVAFGQEMLSMNGLTLLNYLMNQVTSYGIIVLLWITYFFYWRTNPHKRRNIAYFLPLLFLSILFFFRITEVLPIINVLFPDIYFIGFLFFSLYFLFNIKISKAWINRIGVFITLFSIVCVLVSASFSPYFVGYTDLEKNAIDLLPFVEGKFLVTNPPSVTLHEPFFISYASTYYNISSPYGSGPHGTVDLAFDKKVESTQDYIAAKDCQGLFSLMDEIDLQEIMTFDEHCNMLSNCGLNLKAANENVCLYSL